MFIRNAFAAVGLLAMTLAGGCSPFVEGFHYAPHPAVTDIALAATQPSQAPAAPEVTVYASVIGVRREDSDHHVPFSVEIRLRLDNHGAATVTFDPHTLQLSNGELTQFPPPIVAPSYAVTIPPGQPVMVEANFPFPPGFEVNSEGMESPQLRWSVLVDGHPVQQMAAFHRVHHYYAPEPYWGYPYPPYGYPFWGVGGAVIIRR